MFKDVIQETRRFISALITLLASLLLLGMMSPLNAQIPADLPWDASVCGEGKPPTILHRGVAAATCGTLAGFMPADRFTFGLMSLNGIIPPAGEVDGTQADSMYHHPDWTVDKIGTPFGIAINHKTDEIMITASTNWPGEILFLPTVIGHGSIGGPDQITAGGAVYRIDPTTGAPSLFASLPQQGVTIDFTECEGNDVTSRSDMGVGLGNIAYDELNDQYFVTNIEDGRIYRLDNSGNILDSYDPYTYDDGVPGISILSELPYGIAVEPGSMRLLFGQNSISFSGPVPIYSIDLMPGGGFSGTIDNTTMPAGATYDNYVGIETHHISIPVEGFVGFVGGAVRYLSDLEFDSNGNLLIGIRMGCLGSFFTAYNHTGETNVVSLDSGSNLYTNGLFEFDISVTNGNINLGNEDGYGGVDSYVRNDGVEVYAASSSDIITESGPHGVAAWEASNTSSPLEPLGIFSYGNFIISDPKGVGGDVDVYRNSCIKAPACVVPSSPVISVLDNDCSAGTAGSFNVDTPCEAGSSIEFSVNGGTIWTTTPPAYDNLSSLSLMARCVDTTDPTCFSPNSNEVTSLPMDCPDPSPCEDPACDPVPVADVCSDGTIVTLSCEGGLQDVVWFNGSGTQLGTGCDLLIDNTMIGDGTVGQSECFYYEAQDATDCSAKSCCPIIIEVVNCCPEINCIGTITITKN